MNRIVPRAVWLAPLGVLWCVALLTNFDFNMSAPEEFSLIYNDMLARLMHFDFTITRSVADYEVFTRDGRSYTYFGIFPALLRFPAWLAGALDGVEYGRWSCSLALALWITLLLMSVDEVEARMEPARRMPALQWIARLAVLLSGPQIYLISAATIYNESVLWASVMAAAFNLLVLRSLGSARGRPSPLVLTEMAALSGLAANTRPSIGVALGFAVGLLLLREAVLALRGVKPGLLRGVAPAVMVLIALGIVAAGVNYMRWSHPFTFADYRDYDILLRSPGGLQMIQTYGEISLSRLWFGFLYYATGTAYFLQSSPTLLRWIDAHYYIVSTPPAAEPLLMPLQLILAGYGLQRLWRGEEFTRPARLTASLALLGLSFAIFVVLGYYAVTIRYRADYAPFMMLAALLGYPALAARLTEKPDTARRRYLQAGAALLVIGGVFSHYTLVLNKITDRANPMEVRQEWLPLAPFLAGSLTRR